MSMYLRQICLAANRLAPVIDDFKQILGVEVCFVDKGVATFGLENSLMPIGNNFIEVVAPIKENTAAGRYLKRRNGDGGYMVICQAASQEAQVAGKVRAASLGIRIALGTPVQDISCNAASSLPTPAARFWKSIGT